MTTIRKTISISKKDKQLQDLINSVPSYEVSHVIRQLMYEGLKYRALVKQGIINDINVEISLNNAQNQQKETKISNNSLKSDDFDEKTLENDEFDAEMDINSIKLEEIEENDEDLEDILLKNS